MTPLVSVLLPNLNNRAFLQERIDCILAQTLADWQMVVVDNDSDDGAWEFFQELAARDSRVQICQARREGMYQNWNNCVRKAVGRYVYIATSDDTMAPDCLEKLVEALERQPECDVAHCRLHIIDQHGRDSEDWWSESSIFARSSGPLLHRGHVRRAPYDGLLHLSGESVYISITQLLVRRTLFDRVGLFEPRWGSVGDFNWCMRAGLVAHTVHVPETWGGWRVHAAQATAAAQLDSIDHCRKVDEMIVHAIHASAPLLSDPVRAALLDGWEKRARSMRQNSWELRQCESWVHRQWLLLRGLLSGSIAARERLKAHLQRAPRWPEQAPGVIEQWLHSAGVSAGMITT